MDIKNIFNRFDVKEECASYKPLGNGHINSTFLITTNNKNKKYVLQKINTQAFKNVKELMSNFYNVTHYLIEHGFESIEAIKARDGLLYVHEDDGYFRLYTYIDNVVVYEGVNDLKVIENAGKAFGRLHKSLRDYDAKSLYEVIPHFHDTYQRYLNLLEAIKLDKYNRVKYCLNEIEIAKSFEHEYSKIKDGISSGDIHLAVTHNDTKINNVLFDKVTGEVRAVVDLDTVMPGSYLYDYGDALRYLFSGENEDSKDLSLLVVKDDVFEAYSKGYLSEMNSVLTEKEKELLPFSAFLLTIECGIRFLEDYLRGDVYFHISYPEHNLVRARTQLKLAIEIYNSQDRLLSIINRLTKVE